MYIFIFIFSWYHGDIGRSQSESILKYQKHGTYLVRDSATSTGRYVISVRYVFCNVVLGSVFVFSNLYTGRIGMNFSINVITLDKL